jgi:predicted transposase/invertase (TIGR01784 family)
MINAATKAYIHRVPCALREIHLRCIYLNELEEVGSSLGLGILKLIVESQNNAIQFAKQLVNKAREELTDAIVQDKVLEFIETIFVYKFPNLSREEIEAMLNLDLIKHTRVYQEAKEEGKQEIVLEVVPKLLQRGLSLQEIAEILEVDVETVRKAARE